MRAEEGARALFGRKALGRVGLVPLKRVLTAVSPRTLRELPSQVLVAAVRLYQGLLSPLLGPQCRFRPTCSEYFIGAVKKYGPLRGTLRGMARICRCHPLGGWGDDPP